MPWWGMLLRGWQAFVQKLLDAGKVFAIGADESLQLDGGVPDAGIGFIDAGTDAGVEIVDAAADGSEAGIEAAVQAEGHYEDEDQGGDDGGDGYANRPGERAGVKAVGEFHEIFGLRGAEAGFVSLGLTQQRYVKSHKGGSGSLPSQACCRLSVRMRSDGNLIDSGRGQDRTLRSPIDSWAIGILL